MLFFQTVNSVCQGLGGYTGSYPKYEHTLAPSLVDTVNR